MIIIGSKKTTYENLRFWYLRFWQKLFKKNPGNGKEPSLPKEKIHYEIMSIVQETDMSIVFKVKDPAISQEILALKVLKGIDAKHLLAEVKIMRRLIHEAIMPIYDAGKISSNTLSSYKNKPILDGSLYYTMPWATPISQYDMTLEKALNIIMAVTKACMYAHKKGIYHRDIKPDNVLLLENIENKEERWVLGDFGIACISHRTATVAGAPPYWPPEQYNLGHIGAWSDIFAIGKTLKHLITGAVPIPGGDLQESEVQRELERNIASQYSNKIASIICRCCKTKTTDRYQSADDLFKVLEEVLEEGKQTIEFPDMITLGQLIISKSPVTLTQFIEFSSGQGKFRDINQLVTGITYEQANSYCQWLANKSGKKFRLPKKQKLQNIAQTRVTSIIFIHEEWTCDKTFQKDGYFVVRLSKNTCESDVKSSDNINFRRGFRVVQENR